MSDSQEEVPITIPGPVRREQTSDNLRIAVQDDRVANAYSLHIFGAQAVAKPAEFRKVGLYDTVDSPLITINGTEAQGLMDELWRAGIRPKNGEGSVGQIGATERHLADMRALVAHFSNAELK